MHTRAASRMAATGGVASTAVVAANVSHASPVWHAPPQEYGGRMRAPQTVAGVRLT